MPTSRTQTAPSHSRLQGSRASATTTGCGEQGPMAVRRQVVRKHAATERPGSEAGEAKIPPAPEDQQREPRRGERPGDAGKLGHGPTTTRARAEYPRSVTTNWYRPAGPA